MPEMSEIEVLQFLGSPKRWLIHRKEANSTKKKAEIYDGTVSGGSSGKEINYQIFVDLKKNRFIAPDDTQEATETSQRYTITVAGRAQL